MHAHADAVAGANRPGDAKVAELVVAALEDGSQLFGGRPLRARAPEREIPLDVLCGLRGVEPLDGRDDRRVIDGRGALEDRPGEEERNQRDSAPLSIAEPMNIAPSSIVITRFTTKPMITTITALNVSA